MPLSLNYNPPTLLFADLNSAFASCEQQANPLIRGKPVVIVAYNSPRGCVIAPSIEAKRFGIKTGMQLWQARLLYPDVVVRTSDPPKYRYVHKLFANIFRSYSPDVAPLSIDEVIVDLTHTLPLFTSGVVEIGRQIKRRIKTEIGEWLTCSIGIGTNRFLAKPAASLHKPDWLDVIDHTNVMDVYRRVKLLDLNGINTRYQARLNAHGIFMPLEFYNAPLPRLKQQVFRSINSYYWYLRLRGQEIDAIDFARKSFGNTYALQQQTNDPRDLAKLLMKLCEKTGRRLRRANYSAHGVHIAMVYTDLSWWHTGRKLGFLAQRTKKVK